MKLFFVLFCMVSSIYASDFSLTSNKDISSFLNEVEALLPKKLKNRLNGKINVVFRQIDRRAEIDTYSLCNIAKDDKSYHFGYIKKGMFQSYNNISTIYLHSMLLPIIKAGEKGSSPLKCRSKNTYKFVQSVLVHELAHIYDFQEDNIKDMLPKAGKSMLSSTQEYLYLAGFKLVKNPFYRKSLKKFSNAYPAFRTELKNNRILRSPDPYEYTNQYEHFAINFTLFLMDPEYGCRRPRLYKYFVREFGVPDLSQSSCAVNYQIPIENKNGTKLTSIDPKRVYRIDYLLAGEGMGMMSRWGHSMFRIVICAPFRTKVSKECLKDVSYHVVAGFIAKISDLSISMTKGLFGKYPSKVDFYRLANILYQYNNVEYRNLYSYPLDLTETQKISFIEGVIGKYWQYRGKYYFLSNNCAVEGLDLIKSIVPIAGSSVTPQGVKDILVREGLINDFSAEDSSSREYSLVFFASKRQKYESYFDLLKNKYSLHGTLDDFFDRDNHHIVNDVINSEKDNFVLYGLYKLEEVAQRRQYGRFSSYIIGKKEKFSQVISKIKNEKDRAKLTLLKDYGIPLRGEVNLTKSSPIGMDISAVLDAVLRDPKAKKIYTRYQQLSTEIFELKKLMLKKIKQQ